MIAIESGCKFNAVYHVSKIKETEGASCGSLIQGFDSFEISRVGDPKIERF
jgi:hypothetical protein